MLGLFAALSIFAAGGDGQVGLVAVREDSCSLVGEIDGKPQIVGPLADLRVLDGPEDLPVFVAPGAKLRGVMCIRNSIVPDVRDDRVPRSLGVPLFLRRDGPDAVTELKRQNTGFSVVLVSGHWTDEEKRQIIARIELFNGR